MMDIAKTSRKIKSPATAAGKVVLIYAVFAALWILGSDTALEALIRNPAEWARVGMFKGLLFVAATALLLYILLIRLLKTTGEAGQALAAHYATLIEQARDIVLLIDPAGRIVEANRAAEAAYGYRHAELLGMSVDDLRAPESLADVKRQWAAAASTEGVLFETRQHHRDGRVFPVEVSGRAIEIEGKLYRQSFIRDITERRQTEISLKENKERLALAINSNGVGIWDWNLQTLEMVWDDSMLSLYNIQRKDFSGAVDAWGKSLHPDDRERAEQEVQDGISGKKPFSTTFRIIWLNGEIRHIKAMAKVFRDESGKPLRMLGTNIDITELKQAEVTLKDSEFRWKFAIDGSGFGLWDWNIADSTVFFSKLWKEMLGFAESEIGNGLDEWEKRIHPDEKAAVLAAVQDYLDGKTPTYFNEHRVLCKDGSYKWMLDRGMVVSRSEDGKPLRMIGTHTDITERKKTELQLHEQLGELQRWQNAMLERESRIISMKQEVNALLAQLDQPPRYKELGEGDA